MYTIVYPININKSQEETSKCRWLGWPHLMTWDDLGFQNLRLLSITTRRGQKGWSCCGEYKWFATRWRGAWTFWIRPETSECCFFSCRLFFVYMCVFTYINTIMTISWRMFMYVYAYTMWICIYCWVVLFVRVLWNGGNGGTRREIQHGRGSQDQQTSWLLLPCL